MLNPSFQHSGTSKASQYKRDRAAAGRTHTWAGGPGCNTTAEELGLESNLVYILGWELSQAASY